MAMSFTANMLTGGSLLALVMEIGTGAAYAQASPQPPHPPGTVQGVSVPVPVNVDVNYEQLLGADQDTNNWLLYGRTYDNQRYRRLIR